MSEGNTTSSVGPSDSPTEPASSPREEEVRRALEVDQSFLGDVFRMTYLENMTQAQIAHHEETTNLGSIYAYQRNIRALLGDMRDAPDKPSVARLTVNAFKRLLKRSQFSDPVRAELETDLRRFESIVNDDAKVSEETENAIEATREVEAKIEAESSGNATDVGFIYVYSLPHYLRYRIHPESGRTYLKVGKTIRNVDKRLTEQARQTGLPEDPVLLRYYSDETNRRPVGVLERQFHVLMEAADHDRSRAKSAGTEWFTSSVKFTDAVAEALGLKISIVSDLGD